MLSLDDRDWAVFYIGDLFTIKRPMARNKDDYMEGKIPFVASGSVNNGVLKCCEPIEGETLDEACCITVSPVDGSAFYQPYPFLGRGGAGSSVLMLCRSGLDLYTGQFIARMIFNTCSGKYNYGHMGNKDSIKRERIMLPVTDEGQPDYQFMGDYIRELTMEKKKQYRRYVELHIEELCAVPESQMAADWKLLIGSHDWKPFYVVSIFPENERGKRLKKADHVQGNVPYASSTADNNGIDGFIEASEGARVFNDCISLANSGSVGSAFYEPFAFVASDHVTHLKKEGMSKYQYLFLTCLLEQQSGNFNFNREINDARLNKMQIMLPVTDDGQPDYDFMERFGRKMMTNKYKQYLAFLAKR